MAGKTEEKVKVTFYQSGLEPIFWDAENNRALARFEQGIFTTDDPRTINILDEYGYQRMRTENASGGEDSPATSRRVKG